MDSQAGKKGVPNLMQDDRFKAMFANPEFQVDKSADEYRMLAPVLTRLDKGKLKELKRKAQQTAEFSQADEEKRNSSDDDLFSENDDADGQEDNAVSSDEDERVWSKDMKKQYRQIRKDNKLRERRNDGNDDDENDANDEDALATPEPKMVSLSANEFKVKSLTAKINKYDITDYFLSIIQPFANPIFCFHFRTSFGQRLAASGKSNAPTTGRLGNLQMSFNTAPKAKMFKQREKDMKLHREERKGVIRPIKSLRLKKYIPRE